MSFGRPPTFSNFQVLPPERGSFPLDHDGECTSAMREYLACLKANKNNNGACRHLSKAYLACRMDNELMDRDDFSNLGFADLSTDKKGDATSSSSSSASTAGPPPTSGRMV